MEPVDLDLRRSDSGWEPGNPAHPLRLGERADEALALPEALSVGLPDSKAEGAKKHNEVFFSDVATDTDAWFGPTLTGARVAFQLRSQDSPESLRLRLDPGAGATLREVEGAIEVVRNGKRVGSMSAPTAFDADDEPLESSLRLKGSDVLIDVAHRDKDVRYPLALDPAYEGQDSWRNWPDPLRSVRPV